MLKVAILGCGRWGSNHLKVLSKLREENLVSKITVVDISHKARQEAELADAVSDTMSGVDADLVIIATPSQYHAEQAKSLIAAGHHVLVEKPLGCCESEAAQVLASAREFGRIVAVGLLLRFHPAVELANRMLSKGSLGRLEGIRFIRRSTREAPEGENVIEALGVHAIDLICHFMGESEPNAVNAEGDETESRIALEFPHGIEAIVDVSWNASVERRTVNLLGSKANFRFDLGIHNSAILEINGEEEILDCDSSNTPLEAEIRHIINVVNSHNEGTGLQTVPDSGAALRGVRWTQRAMDALPIPRPH